MAELFRRVNYYNWPIQEISDFGLWNQGLGGGPSFDAHHMLYRFQMNKIRFQMIEIRFQMIEIWLQRIEMNEIRLQMSHAVMVL